LPGINAPFSMGVLHPKIILPENKVSNKDQFFIIKHELQHIYNHDIVKKYLIEILVCLYWWFFLIYIYRKQMDIILEFNIDHKIINGKSKKIYTNYVNSLVNIACRSNYEYLSYSNHLCSNFTILELSTLEHRIDFLLEEYDIESTPLLFKIGLLFLPLLLTSFIIEPNFDIKPVGTFEVNSNCNDCYVLKSNHKYYLIIDNINKGTLKHYPSNNKELNRLPLRSK
jgi:hypothetical protein